MKFIKCVIGANYTPVGFVYLKDGKEQYEDFASLCRRKAGDGTLSFSDSGVFGMASAKENGLLICRETVGGGYSAPVDPSLTLVKRIISGGKVVGFVVQDSTGAEVKKHIASILSASKYMKPANYKVVDRAGRQFLQGKGGVKLSSLPSIDLTPGMVTATKKVKTVRTEPYDVVDPKLTPGISLMQLTDVVARCGGAILKLPKDKYKPIGEKYVLDSDEFSRLTNVCQIAPPVINAAQDKISLSYKFRVPGMVATRVCQVLAYVYRNKVVTEVVRDDNDVVRLVEPRLGRVVIAIPEANLQEFYSAVAGSVTVEKMVDPKVLTNTAMSLLPIQDAVFFSVDLTNISLLGPNYDEYLMAAPQIKDVVTKINIHKYAESFAKKIMEGIMFTSPAVSGAGKIWSFYQQAPYNRPEVHEDLKSRYVNLSTGQYSPPYDKMTKVDNEYKVAKDKEPFIRYSLLDKVPTLPKDALDVLSMSLSDVPVDMQSLVAPVIAEKDLAAKYKLAEQLKLTASSVKDKHVLRLAQHKVAMLLDGHNAAHSHDRVDWVSAKVSSRAEFLRFVHPCGVVLEIHGIPMAKLPGEDE